MGILRIEQDFQVYGALKKVRKALMLTLHSEVGVGNLVFEACEIRSLMDLVRFLKGLSARQILSLKGSYL